MNKKNKVNSKTRILEGSHAVALTIKNINPDVISAYPITPQTHIVEDLAKFKADGEADYKYVRAESEFAAASIVLGASANGVRVYSATSSQGILLMTEVLFNIAGMRLPVVITCANRGVSAPITIWNDHQDAMTIRDSGWIMLFAENHQEAVEQHVLAYKIAEKLKLPVMVNIDGFILTHSYEGVNIPSKTEIKKFLPDYKPKKGNFLDPKNPTTMGAFAKPQYYMEIREQLHNDLLNSEKEINLEYEKLNKVLKKKSDDKESLKDNGMIEYYGPKNPKTVIIAMGSVVGTVKDTLDKNLSSSLMKKSIKSEVGVIKIKTFRPFPKDDILEIIKKTSYVAVLDKSISLGNSGPLGIEVKAIAYNNVKAKMKNFIVGLGGRDITGKMIVDIINNVKNNQNKTEFIG
jgi:pyruvate ferredoxin oxidoreductase alpha subunit